MIFPVTICITINSGAVVRFMLYKEVVSHETNNH